jgi:hypothetical protein
VCSFVCFDIRLVFWFHNFLASLVRSSPCCYSVSDTASTIIIASNQWAQIF